MPGVLVVGSLPESGPEVGNERGREVLLALAIMPVWSQAVASGADLSRLTIGSAPIHFGTIARPADPCPSRLRTGVLRLVGPPCRSLPSLQPWQRTTKADEGPDHGAFLKQAGPVAVALRHCSLATLCDMVGEKRAPLLPFDSATTGPRSSLTRGGCLGLLEKK